jgi:histidyl-tRNA synthetase
MYTFKDKGDRSITLKPEGTAGAVRCFIENKLYQEPLPLKTYYLNVPIFRYEKPQSGRLREHHQFGVEIFGSPEPSVDVDIMSLAWQLFGELGFKNLKLRINSIGCPTCRKSYNESLKNYFKDRQTLLCETCRDRLERNPLRILDCFRL